MNRRLKVHTQDEANQKKKKKIGIKVIGFEPIAICTQNICIDKIALDLVSTLGAYRL